MSVTRVNKKKVIQALKKMSCGKRAELVKSLQNDGLSLQAIDEVYDELSIGLGKQRFKLTDFGKAYCESILSFHENQQTLIRLKEKLKI